MVKLFAHSFHPLVLRGFSLKQFIAFGELLPFGFAPVLSKVRRKITPCVCVCMVSFTQCITKSILMIFIGDAIGCIRWSKCCFIGGTLLANILAGNFESHRSGNGGQRNTKFIRWRFGVDSKTIKEYGTTRWISGFPYRILLDEYISLQLSAHFFFFLPYLIFCLRHSFTLTIWLMYFIGVRQRLHIVLSLESESNHISELFESSPFLYNSSTEIVWIATVPISDPAYMAKELSTKCSMEAVRLPIADHWTILDNESIQWNKSPCRFKHLTFTYCSLYKNMLDALQKQQDILQVNSNFFPHPVNYPEPAKLNSCDIFFC